MATREPKTPEKAARADGYSQALRDVTYVLRLMKDKGGTIQLTRGSSLDAVIALIEGLETEETIRGAFVNITDNDKPDDAPTETETVLIETPPEQLREEITRLTAEKDAAHARETEALEATMKVSGKLAEANTTLAQVQRFAFARASRQDAEIAELKLKGRAPRSAWILFYLLVAALAVVVYAMGQIPEIPEPVACPPAVECPAVPEPSTTITVSPDEGYIVEGEYGTRVRPWPDASGYPAETFLQDCRSVCAVPAMMTRDPGRVLTADPEHLVCICFHPGTSVPVTRWINWERQR